MARKKSRSVALAVVPASAPSVVAPRERGLSFGAKWNYAPAPEAVVMRPSARYELFIGGEMVAPRAGEYFPSLNPATEEPLSEIAQGEASDVDAAVHAARAAFKGWSRLPGRERGKYLYRIARLLQERARELACLLYTSPSPRDS